MAQICYSINDYGIQMAACKDIFVRIFAATQYSDDIVILDRTAEKVVAEESP